MPDFERRSSASFISSKEGGTPDSFRRSWMKRRSSYCLLVSIYGLAGLGIARNKSRTFISVLVVFRNPEIVGAGASASQPLADSAFVLPNGGRSAGPSPINRSLHHPLRRSLILGPCVPGKARRSCG